MTTRPLVLDAFCKQGGASAGLAALGCQVVGVDIDYQPRYPYQFIQGDAVDFISAHGHLFDFIWTGPPCQSHTAAQTIRGRTHPDLIPATRAALRRTERPWVIENVEGARPSLRDPVMLCGDMFPGLRMYRHHLFESNIGLTAPAHWPHSAPLAKMGRPVRDHEYMTMVGNFSGVELARQLTGCHWMSRDGLRECIPPVYATHLGRQMLAAIGLPVQPTLIEGTV